VLCVKNDGYEGSLERRWRRITSSRIMRARTIGFLALGTRGNNVRCAAECPATDGVPHWCCSLLGVSATHTSAARVRCDPRWAIGLLWALRRRRYGGSIPFGQPSLLGIEISIQCSTIRGSGSRRLASDTIVFVQPTIVRRDWVVETAGRDLRPVRHVTGVFRGHYRPGFESSEFVPCPAHAWFIPGDSLDSYPIDMRRA